MMSRRVSGAVRAAPARRAAAGRPMKVSRQPRLPHRQTGPFSSIVDVADLARRARAAPEELAAEDQAGTHAVGGLDVDPVPRPLAAHRNSARPGPRGWPCCPAAPAPSRPSISAATATPRHPGQDALGADLAGHPVDGGRHARRRPRARRTSSCRPSRTRSKSSREARSMPSSAAWSAGSGIRLRPTMSAPPVPIATRTSRSPKAMAATRPCASGERHQHGSPPVADARGEPHRTRRRRARGRCSTRSRGSTRSPRRSRPGSSRRSPAPRRAPAGGSSHGGMPASPALDPLSSRGKHKTSGPGVEELRPFRRVRPAPSGPVPPRWSPASEATGRDAGAPASRARRRPVDAIRPGTDPFPSPTGSGVGAVRRCWFDGG